MFIAANTCMHQADLQSYPDCQNVSRESNYWEIPQFQLDNQLLVGNKMPERNKKIIINKTKQTNSKRVK